MVAGLGDVLGEHAATCILKNMKLTPGGKKILYHKPIISSSTINYDFLMTLPENTLGRHYLRYMQQNNFDVNERSIVRFVMDPDVAYVILRYRQVHDFWHVICDLPPSVLGEIALKWFEWRQVVFLMNLISYACRVRYFEQPFLNIFILSFIL